MVKVCTDAEENPLWKRLSPVLKELCESTELTVRETRYSRQAIALDLITLSKGKILSLSLDIQPLDGLPENLHDELKNRVRISSASRVHVNRFLRPLPPEYRLQELPADIQAS
jgi:hypothetical protein